MVHGLRFIHARYVTHKFARHVHDYFVLGIIEDGLQTFSYRGAKHGTATGAIILLNPDEPHTGEAAKQSGDYHHPPQRTIDCFGARPKHGCGDQ